MSLIVDRQAQINKLYLLHGENTIICAVWKGGTSALGKSMLSGITMEDSESYDLFVMCKIFWIVCLNDNIC